MPLASESLREIAVELVSRPGHEKVRGLVYRVLVDGLGASSTEIQFERPLPEVHGRTDALLGRTVFEFKTNLRRESRDAEEELTRYLAQREREMGGLAGPRAGQRRLRTRLHLPGSPGVGGHAFTPSPE